MSKFPSQMQDKFNLRFPEGMRDAIAERAKRNCRSMNSEIIQILDDALKMESNDTSIGTGDGDTRMSLMQAQQQVAQLSMTLQSLLQLEELNKKPE